MSRKWINFIPFLAWCYLIFYLFNLQVIKHHNYSIRAKNQHEMKVKLVARRGNIYDRNGLPLAISIRAYSVYAVTKYIKRSNQVAMRLAKLGLGSYRALCKKLKTKRFFWLTRKADENLANKIKKLHLPGIGVIDEYLRDYPQKDYIGDLIGQVSTDNRGLSGIEYQLDSILSGRDGLAIFQKKPSGRGYPYPHYPMLEPRNGADVYLTIDFNIQILLCDVLSKALARFHAKQAAGIVIEPQTGKILALVNVNDEKCHNFVVSDEFEPGSTFKIVTLASALIDGHRLDERVDVRGGKMKVGGHWIHDFRDYGILDLKGVFVHSSNIGAVKIGKEIRSETFFQTARALGFGSMTGINLPGETKGKIYLPKQMRKIRYANNCFGQGLSVTLLQLTNAYAAVAAQGRLFRPFIIEKITGTNHDHEVKPFLIREAISPKICRKICTVLEEVVNKGTGRLASSKMIGICGKTGTAQKPGDGGYIQGKILTSFVGFFPAKNPKYAIGVMVDEPEVGNWASQITAPIFGEIVDGFLKIPGLLGGYYACAQ